MHCLATKVNLIPVARVDEATAKRQKRTKFSVTH